MTLTLTAEDGTLLVEELGDGRRRLTSALNDSTVWVPYNTVETSYPLDLIEFMLKKHGAIGVCYEILRDEDPHAVERLLKNDIFGYFDAVDFENKTILEFGCGSGASTVILQRLFPTARITGVEMSPEALSVARRRVAHHGFDDIQLYQSPGGTELPKEIDGHYDFVILSAVYEHILPHEKMPVMKLLWKHLRDGGYLFINQTPNLLFPFELHTTMLPLINYLPDKTAFKFARRFSSRVLKEDSWENLLRKGIRGATVKEILGTLPDEYGTPVLLSPDKNGLKDRIDLYYLNTNQERLKTLKQIAKFGIKAIYKITGAAIIPDLSLAIQKKSRVVS